jgi:hypothetical protein
MFYVKKLLIALTACTRIYKFHIIIRISAIISLKSINQLVCVMETQGVFNKFLSIISINLRLQKFNYTIQS